jgi:hypothetical protein
VVAINIDHGILANLTHSNLFQKHTQNSYVTYNGVSYGYGPTFGAGHDFHLSGDLITGYANIGFSYGDRSRYNTAAYQQSLTGTGGYNSNWTVGKLETFTMTAGLYEPLTPVALHHRLQYRPR